jgi:peptidoglycan/LPS O-acetylase OafA/YrhL
LLTRLKVRFFYPQICKEGILSAEQEENIAQNFADASVIARTLACMMVVLVHVNFAFRPGIGSWWPGGFIFAPFFSLLVPVFLIFSGYFADTGSVSAQYSHSYFFKSRARRLMVPFVFWNIVVIFLQRGFSSPVGLLTLFSLTTGAWQLYYLFVLFQLQVLHRFVFPLTGGMKQLKVFIAAAGVISLSYYVLADVTLWLNGAISDNFELYYNRLFIPWCVYFAIGICLGRNIKIFSTLIYNKEWLLAFCLSSYLIYYWELVAADTVLQFNPLGQFMLSGFFFQVSTSLLALILIYQWQKSTVMAKIKDTLARWSGDTYGIFLIHTAVLIILIRFYNRSGFVFPFELEVPIFCFSAWFCSQGLVCLLRLNILKGAGRFILGETKTAQNR